MAVESSNSPQASLSCPHCETSLPANADFCPACGWSMKPLPAGDRAIAALAYFSFLPAVILLLMPSFRTRRFVRFHAWQSILIWGSFLLLTAIAILSSNLAQPMVLFPLGILAVLAILFLWIVLSIKAWQGERFELPLFGKLAGRLR
jgi:uncharacterized membrane protein